MSKFKVGDHVVHRKGGQYAITMAPEETRLEADGAPAYGYRAWNKTKKALEGPTWVRAAVEMEDGRFVITDGSYAGLYGPDFGCAL